MVIMRTGCHGFFASQFILTVPVFSSSFKPGSHNMLIPAESRLKQTDSKVPRRIIRVIRIRISKNRQHNDQKKKYKRTNNELQNIHIKLKIE